MSQVLVRYIIHLYCLVGFTDVSLPYSSLPIHVRYLYVFATNDFATYTLSLPSVFTIRHHYSHSVVERYMKNKPDWEYNI